MRLAFVIATHGWGGVKTWYLQFAEGLKKRGHEIRMYGSRSEFIEQAKKRIGHGVLLHFGPDFGPAVLFFLREFREFRPDTVVVNIGKDLKTAGIAARILGIPVVQRIGLPKDIKLNLRNRLLHSWIRPRFLCPCRFIADGLLQALPYVQPERVGVVLNGRIPMPQAPKNHSPRRLVCTQQLTQSKGHEILFHALAELQDFAWELHIYGRGNHEKKLHTLSEELGLTKRIIWHGFASDIPSVLQDMDIFLLGSFSEGLPNTLLEAMAAGLLPIARNVGGVSEIFPPSLAPWLLPYTAQSDAFRHCILEALKLNDEQLTAWKKESLKACEEYFHLNNQIQKLEQWLQNQDATKHN